MDYDVVLITPTRSRPEQFSIMLDSINEQTCTPDYWVIVDDGRDPLDSKVLDKIHIPFKYIYYRPQIYNKSTCHNSAIALEAVSSKVYVFIDDDDYYPPKYIETLIGYLQGKNDFLVCENRWVNYRLSTGYYQDNTFDSSHHWEWHGSAFTGETLKGDMIKQLYAAGSNGVNDIVSFNTIFKHGPYKWDLVDMHGHHCVSMKDYGVGGPGCISQHFSNKWMQPDTEDYAYFKKALGGNWTRYEKYLGTKR